MTLNSIIKEGGIKLKEPDTATFQIKTVQHQPSIKLVLHPESQAHAGALANQPTNWPPRLLTSPETKPKRHAGLVYEMPRSFDPEIKDHLEDLIASNREMLSAVTSIRLLDKKVINNNKKVVLISPDHHH